MAAASPITIARPYAKAAFMFACENKQLEPWFSLLKSAAIIAADTRVKVLLTNPHLEHEPLLDLFFSILKCDKYQKDFFKILTEHHRLVVLPQILKHFHLLYIEHKKQIEVDVVSAFELTKTQKTKLTKALEKHLDSKVKMHCTIDKSILGGAIIHAGNLLIDGSARTKLSQLLKRLKGRSYAAAYTRRNQ